MATIVAIRAAIFLHYCMANHYLSATLVGSHANHLMIDFDWLPWSCLLSLLQSRRLGRCAQSVVEECIVFIARLVDMCCIGARIGTDPFGARWGYTIVRIWLLGYYACWRPWDRIIFCNQEVKLHAVGMVDTNRGDLSPQRHFFLSFVMNIWRSWLYFCYSHWFFAQLRGV